MALIVRRNGDGWDSWVKCDVCGKPFGSMNEVWIGCGPLDPDVDVRDGVLAHRKCLDGACQQLFGVSKAVHWRGIDYFARLFSRPATDVLASLQRQRAHRSYEVIHARQHPMPRLRDRGGDYGTL